MFVCALVLTVGLAAVMGILYSNFGGQMRKELSKEAAYLAYGVEQQGTDYQKLKFKPMLNVREIG